MIIDVYFTKENKLPLQDLPKSVNEALLQRKNLKLLSVKKEYIVPVIHGRRIFLVAKLESFPRSFDDIQSFGAKVFREAYGLMPKKESIRLRLSYHSSLLATETLFLEKGVLLAEGFDKKWTQHSEEKEYKIEGCIHKELVPIVEGIRFSRMLVARPANMMRIYDFVSEVSEKMKAFPSVSVQVLEAEDLVRENMNLHLAVNAGSSQEARLMILDYAPHGMESERPLVLVGKGLIYDSGGMYMKPDPAMNDMYGDMAGASTVVGLIIASALGGVQKRIVALCPLAENMVDAHSYRNGDILVSKSGKTVEVAHSDAEGRLVLADTLTYAQEHYSPDMIFDFATLTGACMGALGELYTGIFSDNTNLIKEIWKIGDDTNDRMWPLPLDDECKQEVKGKRSDLINTSQKTGRMLGASTAAAFLSHFIENTKQWMHFDIAGSALRSVLKKPYDPQHLLGTGSAIHTVYTYITKHWR